MCANQTMPTEEELKIRVLMARSPALRVVYLAQTITDSSRQFSRAETEASAECFQLAPLSDAPVKITKKADSQIGFGFDSRTPQNDLAGIHVGVSADGEEGIVFLDHSTREQHRLLHPESAKRWIELLRANARRGDELRNRLESE